jgi:hypothetical protein
LSTLGTRPDWAAVIDAHAAVDSTGRRLISQLRACEAAALAFCRLLEGWRRGEPEPCTPGKRQAALRRAAERAETALTGLEDPLGLYLLELEVPRAEGRSWYGEPGIAELVEWDPVLQRAGVQVAAGRVAQAYLELAVLVRALDGLAASVRFGVEVDSESLWAGLFDLRENLFGRAIEDLQALAVA